MMKRTGVPRIGPDEPAPLPPQNQSQIQQAGASNMHTLAQSAQPQILGTAMQLSVGGAGFARATAARPSSGSPAVINYLKTSAVSYATTKPQPPQMPPRLKLPHQQPIGPLPTLERQSPVPAVSMAPSTVAVGAPPSQQPPGAQFQRLKVEDALSYLDQVKYKFNTQPQVYNDFLDIMKEFKSQTIDTPGVITRVSNLFKGHPELIVGFNTFLPPGYKIEVQRDGQVSVSMPSPTGLGAGGAGGGVGGGPGGTGGVLLGVPHQPQPQLVHLLPVAQSVNSAIVHNLSVNATPTNTLHQISQAHQQIEAAAIHHQPGTVQPPAGSGPHTPAAPPGQPVEFNHAIEYVNKIKSRFSRQPDKYKRFLEILHAYQRGHRDVKEPQAKQQTEQEVYSQVAKLFENQDDLLAEFGQFLPDAKAVTKPPDRHYPPHVRTPPLLPPPQQRVEPEPERYAPAPPASPPHTQHHHPTLPKHTSTSSSTVTAPSQPHHHLKRSPTFTPSSQISVGAPPAKKSRISNYTSAALRDVSYAEASKLATVHEYNFFDKVKKALKSQNVYDNFLRCLQLFTNEIISSSEVVSVTAPFLRRHPELQKWLHDFVAPPSPPLTPTAAPGSTPALATIPPANAHPYTANTLTGYNSTPLKNPSTNNILGYDRERLISETKAVRYEPIGALGAQLRHDRPQGDAAMDIDLTTCKRLGTSYCALPREAAARRCSGRTALCKEVLNDTWVSFPTWSEDSTFVTSRKTQYEEYIYRCEDERFELDVVIETNASTIRVLEGVQKKLSRMTAEDAAKYRLDDCLGGHSPTIHQRALRRIYGDKAVDIIAGLKKNPVVAVPVVLRRLKAKEEEWREAQKGFNKQWREQNEKYYLKSLDHQGINFKQNDLKAMRSKSLFNEVEAAYAARRPGPHLVVDYNMQSRQEAIKILRDASELFIHHARRQTGIQKAEKRRIKQLLRQFLPDLFAHPRQPLSDDERDEEEKEELASPDSPSTEPAQDNEKTNSSNVKQEKQESSESDNASDKSSKNNKNNKENKPKNNINSDLKDGTNPTANNVKRPNNEDQSLKSEVKMEPQDLEDDYRDYPPNEARFVCTSSWYLFLRVHGCVCARLAAARRAALALAAAERASPAPAHAPAHAPADNAPASAAQALRLKPNNLPADVSSPAEYYNVLLELVKGVLDGNMESSAYEDAAREMLGIKAYPAYTLDKLVSIAVRQLQQCVSEPWSVRAGELAARGGGRAPLHHVRRAATLLRHEHTIFLVKLYGGDECKVTYELLEGAGEGRTSPQQNDNPRLSPTNQCRPGAGPSNGGASRLAAWSCYREQYACSSASDPVLAGAGPSNGRAVFLRRTARGRAGRDTHNAAAGGCVQSTVVHGRRKPPRLVDATECHVAASLRCRLLAFRPLHLYRAGALRAARASHARLHAARRRAFRAWLHARN